MNYPQAIVVAAAILAGALLLSDRPKADAAPIAAPALAVGGSGIATWHAVGDQVRLCWAASENPGSQTPNDPFDDLQAERLAVYCTAWR